MTNANLREVFVPASLLVMSVVAACNILGGCGGDTTTGTGVPEGGPADGTTDGYVGADGSGDSGAPVDGTAADSTAFDTGAATDALSPGDSGPSDGGSPADGPEADGGADAPSAADGSGESGIADATSPGTVHCGASTCDTNTSYCCRTGLDPSLETCNAADAGCTGSLWRCEKPSDCPGANCIVGGVTSQGGLTTACAKDNHWVLCASSMDCMGSQTCVTQTCHYEGGVESVGVCGGSLPATICP
jgi:hypothetical protein